MGQLFISYLITRSKFIAKNEMVKSIYYINEILQDRFVVKEMQKGNQS